MNSPAKTSSGKSCKKCMQKGSKCVQHGGSPSPKKSSKKVVSKSSPKSSKRSSNEETFDVFLTRSSGSRSGSPKKKPARFSSPNSPSKKAQEDWEMAKFKRELTEKLEKLETRKSPAKSPVKSPNKLRSPNSTRKAQPTDEYEGYILEFLKKKEKSFPISDKFPKQTEFTETMRSIFVDWIVEVSQEYHLLYETLHLGVTLFDRYMSLKNVSKAKAQLFGMTCLLIAAKSEELFPPSIDDFVYISDNVYKRAEVKDAEVVILQALKYEITHPTCAVFASIYFDILNLTQEQRNMARYVMDSSMIHFSSYKYLPSLVAAGAIFYAIRAIPGKTRPGVWSSKMEKVTGYSEEEVRQIAISAIAWLKPGKYANTQLAAIKLKYERVVNSRVANIDIVTLVALQKESSPGASPKKSPVKASSPKKIPSPKKAVAKASSPKKASPKEPSPKKIDVVKPLRGEYIRYSDRYPADDGYEYRHVILPPSIARLVPRGRLLTENEWRSFGVMQSRGWVHYSLHRPEPHILLFRKPL